MRAGIFVGGRSRRMGTPKGLLPSPTHPGLTLLEALVEQARAASLEVVLVGRAEPYAHLARDVPRLADRDPEGPLGGLVALLAEGSAIAIACDQPYLSAADLTLLASHRSSAVVVAAHRGGAYEPFPARYSGAAYPRLQSAVDRGVRSFQAFFREIEVETIALSPSALRDWDTPADLEP